MTTTTLAPIHGYVAHDDPVNHVVFSREGGLLASSDTAMRVKLWRFRQFVREFDLRSISEKVRPTERIRGLCFNSAEDRLLVAAGEVVASFNLNSPSDQPEWAYTAPRLLAFLIVSPTSIAVSSDDELAATFDNGTIAVWGPNGDRRALIRHNAVPRMLAYLPDESLIGSDGFSVSLWRKDQRKPVWHRSSKERIYGLAASRDGKLVAVRQLHRTEVFEIESGAHVGGYKLGRGLPLVEFGPGTHTLAIGSQHAIDLYDVDAGSHARLSLDDAELISLTFFSDSSQIVAGCSDGTIRTWDNPLRQVFETNEA
ncbi:MAG TPA: WD40 repeat domain-containing protein [Fimbriimonadaceae bacterium]|nr:WD40 repeat domain-containing protein [Fimbriimonadaceae bacterium]